MEYIGRISVKQKLAEFPLHFRIIRLKLSRERTETVLIDRIYSVRIRCVKESRDAVKLCETGAQRVHISAK